MTPSMHISLKEYLWSLNFDKEYNGEEIKIHSVMKSIMEGNRIVRYSMWQDGRFVKSSATLGTKFMCGLEVSYRRNNILEELCR